VRGAHQPLERGWRRIGQQRDRSQVRVKKKEEEEKEEKEEGRDIFTSENSNCLGDYKTKKSLLLLDNMYVSFNTLNTKFNEKTL